MKLIMFHLSFSVNTNGNKTKREKYLMRAAWRVRRCLVRGHREAGRPHPVPPRHGGGRGHRERGGPAVAAPGGGERGRPAGYGDS